MTFDVLCLGEPLIEFNQQSNGSYTSGFGGDTSNSAISAARQGAKVGYITRIGGDTFGMDLQKLWASEGVDATHVETDMNAPTGIYFVNHDRNGHHFSYRRAGSAASLMTPSFLPEVALKKTKILHVSGISQAISNTAADTVFQAIEIVRSSGGKVSYDSNLRLQLWPIERARSIIHAGMSQCDIALPGLDDAQLLTGLTDPDSIVDFYLGLGAKVVALTLGARGTLIGTTHDRKVIAAHKVQAVDATGAGDTFNGAFLARIAAGDPVFMAANYANVAAGISTLGYGAVEPIPTQKIVTAHLQRSAD